MSKRRVIPAIEDRSVRSPRSHEGNEALRRLKRQLASGNALSLKYGALADYVLRHHDEVAFLTAAELARRAGTSEATAIRFANYLSFRGYPEFQREFQRMVTSQLSTLRRLRDSRTGTASAGVPEVIDQEMRNLEEIQEHISYEDLVNAGQAVAQSSVLYVVGLRASACLAHYFSYQAAEIVPRVVCLTHGGTDSVETLERSKGGLMVAFALPRYPRETIELVDAAREVELPVIGITDSFASPIAERSSIVLLVSLMSSGVVDLLAGPLVVGSAILQEAAKANDERVLHGLARFEKFAERAHLFWEGGGQS